MVTYYLYTWAPFLIIIGIFVLIAFRAYTKRVREKEQLKKIAFLFGFTFSDQIGGDPTMLQPASYQSTAKTGMKDNVMRTISGWEMKGRHNGVDTRIYSKKISIGGDRSSEYTCIDAVATSHSNCSLMITRETSLSRLGKAIFEMQDIRTSNEELDRRLVIKGAPEHFVKRILQNTDLQHELLALFEMEGTIYVDQHGAHFQKQGVIVDEQLYRKLLEKLSRTASSLERASAS